MTASYVDQLAEALKATESMVAGVRNDQWGDPTPCADWTVSDLVRHVIGGNHLFASALNGEPSTPLHLAPHQSTDHIDAPVPAFRESADALVAAFSQPGGLERTVTVPFGQVPGLVALHLRLVETLVHGWDLGRATGQTPQYDDEVAEQELAFSRSRLADIPPDRTPFAPSEPAPEGAAPIDRLAACLGRPVT